MRKKIFYLSLVLLSKTILALNQNYLENTNINKEKTKLILSYNNGYVALVNLVDFKIESSWKASKSNIYHSCFSSDGKNISTVSKDNKIKIWDIETKKRIKSFNISATMAIFSPGDEELLISSSEGIFAINISTGEEVFRINEDGSGLKAYYNHAGTKIITNNNITGKVNIYIRYGLDLEREIDNCFPGHISISLDDSRIMISSGLSCTVKNMNSGEIITDIDHDGVYYHGVDNLITCCDFGKDNNNIVFSCKWCLSKVNDQEDENIISENSSVFPFNYCSFGLDDNTIIATTLTGEVQIYKITDAESETSEISVDGVEYV